MLSVLNRLALTALLGVGGLVLCVAQVHAQGTPPANSAFRLPPQTTNQPVPQTQAVAYSTAPRTSFQPQAQIGSYYPPNFYQPYFQGPVAGYLNGAANVVQAQGQFAMDYGQANLTNEQVRQAKLDTQRKQFDQWLYERQMTPTLEDDRERARLENLRRSQNDPPATEIWSGKALNDLLLDVQQLQASVSHGPNIALAPDVVSRINVSSGATYQGIGLLRDGGKLSWPLPLRKAAFDADRKRIDKLLPEAFKQAETGQVDAGTLSGLSDAADSMMSQLKQQVSDISANDYIAAKRYLNELNDTLKVLQDPNVANYVTRKWAAKGNNVGELVAQMTSQGLKFAPATSGDQAAYNALHRALASYDTGMHQLVGR